MSDTTATTVALARMVQPTSNPVDLKLTAWALRLARTEGCYEEALAEVRRRRDEWRTWLFLNQRKWQRQTRCPSKARHHDSISIRERYVRCGA